MTDTGKWEPRVQVGRGTSGREEGARKKEKKSWKQNLCKWKGKEGRREGGEWERKKRRATPRTGTNYCSARELPPAVPVLWGLGQEEGKFKPRLGNSARPCSQLKRKDKGTEEQHCKGPGVNSSTKKS